MKIKLFIVALCIISITPLFSGGKEFTVEDIFGSSKFASKSIRGIQWMSDGRSYCIQEMDTVSKSIGIFRVNVKGPFKVTHRLR